MQCTRLFIFGKRGFKRNIRVKSPLYFCIFCHFSQPTAKAKATNVQLMLKAFDLNLAIIYLASKESNLLVKGCNFVIQRGDRGILGW